MSKPKCPLLGAKPHVPIVIHVPKEIADEIEDMAERMGKTVPTLGGAIMTAALKLKKASGKPTKTSR